MEEKLSGFIFTHLRWQNIAGVLLASSMVLRCLSSFVFEYFKPFSSLQIAFLWMSYIPWVATLVGIVALIILYKLAINEPTKIATSFIVFFWISGLVSSVLYYVGFSSDFELISLDAVSLVITVDSLISIVALPYSYSLIICNNSLEKGDQTWINILMICIVGNALSLLSSIIVPLTNFYNLYSFDSHMQWNNSFGLACYRYIFTILLVIAYWRFAHCSAFNKTAIEESPAKYSYSPINKYVVGMFVVLAIMSGVFYLLFANAENIISFVESIF